MTWQLVYGGEVVHEETSMLPPEGDTRPVWIVSVSSRDSDDGAGDVFIKYTSA